MLLYTHTHIIHTYTYINLKIYKYKNLLKNANSQIKEWNMISNIYIYIYTHREKLDVCFFLTVPNKHVKG